MCSFGMTFTRKPMICASFWFPMRSPPAGSVGTKSPSREVMFLVALSLGNVRCFNAFSEVSMTLTAADEEMLLFGTQLPSVKRMMQQQEAESQQDQGHHKRLRGTGQGKGRGHKGRAPKKSGQDQLMNDVETSLLDAMMRLSLKHEDLWNRLQQDTTHAWTFENTQDASNTIPLLYNVAQQWKSLKEKEPQKLTRNLRTTVMLGLLQELHTRVQRVKDVEGAAHQATGRGWLRQGSWLYLKWDADSQQLVEDKEREPLPADTILGTLNEAVTFLKEGTLLHKFQATRPLVQDMKGEVLTFLSELSVRGQTSDRMFEILRMWEGNAALKMVGVRIRGARPQRSKMANLIQQYLDQR